MPNQKLLVTETHYESVSILKSLQEPKRLPKTSQGTLVDDVPNSSCTLQSGRRVTITDTGALIDNKLMLEVSATRRTGGRLVSENIAINIRPLTNSKVDELLAEGYQLSHTPTNGNPI